jgi:hypothetical protein
MEDSTKRELEVGDIVLIHETGTNNWSWWGMAVIIGGHTAGGKPYMLGVWGRKMKEQTSRLIKVNVEFARELFESGAIYNCSREQFETLIEEHNKMKGL